MSEGEGEYVREEGRGSEGGRQRERERERKRERILFSCTVVFKNE